MQMPEATPVAEHLKNVVQTVLGAFQSGAGICNGLPEPMTFELAVQTLWREIDKAFYTQWPKNADKRIQLRVSKTSGTFEELLLTLSVCGKWTVRASSRGGVRTVEGYDGLPERPGSVVAHAVGILNRKTKPDSVIGLLNKEGWAVTDLLIGI